jgi:antitoxin component YwqK of YwqJK toxin-antitoxin module
MKQLYTAMFFLASISVGFTQFEPTPLAYAKIDSVKNFGSDESVYKSVYSRLDTLKFYDVELETETFHGRTTFWVNGKEVTKNKYDFYDHHWKNVDRCTPCFLKTYDTDEKLLKEGVQYGDCNIGEWTEYFLCGKVKLKGRYKENETGDWYEIWTKGLCSVKHGTWIYYNEHGDVLYAEKYYNGTITEEP